MLRQVSWMPHPRTLLIRSYLSQWLTPPQVCFWPQAPPSPLRAPADSHLSGDTCRVAYNCLSKVPGRIELWSPTGETGLKATLSRLLLVFAGITSQTHDLHSHSVSGSASRGTQATIHITLSSLLNWYSYLAPLESSAKITGPSH